MPPKSITPASTSFDDSLRDADPRVQNAGVATAVALGAEAVPTLLALLADPHAARGQVMFALAEIADPRARDAYGTASADPDEVVRAQAARGLARIDDPRALAACLLALNDAPDLLHLDRTPAIEALGAMGLNAVPGLLARMAEDDELTRLRAQRALESLLGRRHGLQPGSGLQPPGAEAAMQAEWLVNGSYDHQAPPARRADSLQRWQSWLDLQEGRR